MSVGNKDGYFIKKQREVLKERNKDGTKTGVISCLILGGDEKICGNHGNVTTGTSLVACCKSMRSFDTWVKTSNRILLRRSNGVDKVNIKYHSRTLLMFSGLSSASSASSSQACKEATVELYFSQLDSTSSNMLLTLRTSMDRLLHWVTTSRMNLRTPVSPSSTGGEMHQL